MITLIALTVGGVACMFAGMFNARSLLLPLAIIGTIASILCGIYCWNGSSSAFSSMMIMDHFAIAFSIVCIAGAFFSLLLFSSMHDIDENHLAELYALILFSLAGCVVMLSYTNLLMLFLGIEILSLSLYIMAGLRKRDLSSNESSLKYFLMGAFSTGFLLFGIAMIYGASGSFDLKTIQQSFSVHSLSSPVFIYIGVFMILVGLLFKVSAAPFHFWTPDVYEGAPTLVTGYMSSVGKIAALGAFLRLIELTILPAKINYENFLWCVIVITLLVGNITALYQNKVKRMLAYSSISHAGYMLLALLSSNHLSDSALLLYAISYTLASIAAFGVVFIVQQRRGNDDVQSFRGLSKSSPLLAFVFAISMLSLAGIPPTAGFFAKFEIFSSAVSDGWIWLTVIAVINSFISIYYYFRPMIEAYSSSQSDVSFNLPLSLKATLFILAIATVVFGVFPGLVSGLL